MHIKCSFLFYSNEGMRRWGEFDFGLKNEFFSQSLWNFLPIGPWDREGQGKNQLCEFGDRTTAFYSSWWDLFANPTQPHTRPSSPAWRTPIMHCNGKHHQTSTEPGIILKALLIVRICSQCFFIGKIKKTDFKLMTVKHKKYSSTQNVKINDKSFLFMRLDLYTIHTQYHRFWLKDI